MAEDTKNKDLAKQEKDIEARGKRLEAREKDLDELAKTLDAKEQALNALAKDLAKKEKALAEKEKEIESAKPAGRRGSPDEKKKEPTDAEKKLIAECCKAYGIESKFVFASGIADRNGEPEAVVVTNGGSKVRYCKGDEVEPLTEVEVDGISRKKPRVVAGKKKK